MTFEEHLEGHRRPDGSYDLAAAEQDRAAELAADPEQIDQLAHKAAKNERAAWERRNSERLRKQFGWSALSPELELDALVPLGDGYPVPFGEMNRERIQLRKDFRTKGHLDEIRAYDAEMTHWLQTEPQLNPGETIAEALDRQYKPEEAEGEDEGVA